MAVLAAAADGSSKKSGRFSAEEWLIFFILFLLCAIALACFSVIMRDEPPPGMAPDGMPVYAEVPAAAFSLGR